MAAKSAFLIAKENATSTIEKLRFLRSELSIADVNTEMSGYAKLPSGITAGLDGVVRSKFLLLLVKRKR